MHFEHVLLARALFATSLGVHIIYSTLGVGMPFMIAVAEITYVLTKDTDYLIMAKRWTRGFGVLLAVGIGTGTTVALQLTLLWPKFMRVVGQVIAMPFLIEIFAFFIEALFLSIYIYASELIPTKWRITSVVAVSFGAALSAVLITDANAFMNTPRGFRMVNGQAVDVHPWQAMFNPAFPTEATHVVVSALMTVAFITAAVAAFGILKSARGNQRIREHRTKALSLSLALGGIFSILTAVAGDASGKFLAHYQPEKLAVAEGLFRTTDHAPLIIGGWVDPATERVIGGLPIPNMLSWLATDRFDGVVQGLHDFPRDTWPPLYVHLLFDLMVGIGTLLILIALFAWVLKMARRTNENMFPRWLLWVIVACGPVAMIAIEAGWIYAEIARQPWTIYGLMRTAEAVTSAPYVGWLFILFVILYVGLSLGAIIAIRSYFARHKLEDEIERGPIKPRRVVWLP